jgi:hypothetical protein
MPVILTLALAFVRPSAIPPVGGSILIVGRSSTGQFVVPVRVIAVIIPVVDTVALQLVGFVPSEHPPKVILGRGDAVYPVAHRVMVAVAVIGFTE